MAALIFLDLNGVEIRDPQGCLLGAMFDVADRRLAKDGLATLFRTLATAP